MLPVALLKITLIVTFVIGLIAFVAGALAVRAHGRRASVPTDPQTSDD